MNFIDHSSYDFDLRTGHSETGLNACTYAVEVKEGEDGVESVWIETPKSGQNWSLVEIQPVSEGMTVSFKTSINFRID